MRDKDARDFQGRVARQGGVGGAQMKTTTRNLRIREDTAKYLRNLDPNSAYYDPKTRSMRDNPLPNANPEELPFAGDNFERISGDAVELARTTVFAWEATERSGGDTTVDSIANPSQVEFARREFEKKKATLEASRKRGVFDRYGTGGAETLDADHAMRRLAAAETEVERILKKHTQQLN
jgi:pre-mRNA-processing factor SLU7